MTKHNVSVCMKASGVYVPPNYQTNAPWVCVCKVGGTSRQEPRPRVTLSVIRLRCCSRSCGLRRGLLAGRGCGHWLAYAAQRWRAHQRTEPHFPLKWLRICTVGCRPPASLREPAAAGVRLLLSLASLPRAGPTVFRIHTRLPASWQREHVCLCLQPPIFFTPVSSQDFI